MLPTCSVLLDLDGTLIDSQPGILASCLAALRTLGHEPDEILDIKRVIGPPLEDVMQFLLQPYGDDRIAEAVAAYRQHYGESGLLGSEAYPGIGGSLEEMQQAGLRIHLATSKRATFARRILELDLRITLETDDHALIYMTFQGLRDAPPDVIAAFSRGEVVDPARYYFRTVPRFETSAEAYAFLNRIVAIGVGETRPDGAVHRIDEIL